MRLRPCVPAALCTCGAVHPACAPLFRGPGWDWAPYTHTFLDGAHTFSKGVWKDVYLVASAPAAAAITYVVPQIFYQARPPPPSMPLRMPLHSTRVHTRG